MQLDDAVGCFDAHVQPLSIFGQFFKRYLFFLFLLFPLGVYEGLLFKYRDEFRINNQDTWLES